MEKYEKVILKRFENFDVSSKEKAIESFKKLWRDENKFIQHIKKREELGHIKDKFDYLEKTLKCLATTEYINIAIYKKSWDNIYFEAISKDWAVIFNENGEIMTSYKIENKKLHFIDVHKKADILLKGVKNELQSTFKTIYDIYKHNS